MEHSTDGKERTMSRDLKEFQRKIANRQYAIDYSWRGDSLRTSVQETVSSEEDRLWRLLNENLSEADTCKQFDGYLPIYSHHRKIGKLIIFCKRAMRKLLKIFWGWYIFPLYERLTCFHGKIVNVVSVQRDLISKLQTRLNELECKQEAQTKTLESQQELHTRELEHERELHARKLEQMNQELAKTKAQLSAVRQTIKKMENLPTDDDEFYHCFEEKFRGSIDEIRERLRVYVPEVQQFLPDWSKGRFIDVGSGRGEWLDILRENGALDYVGVDLNRRQNGICKTRGHVTVCEDCIQYLKKQPENSVDLITGFQIIEHLAMSDLMELLKQSYHALKPGGMILFETPNPRNLIVGADTFYIDPSHKRPLPSELVGFFVEWNGFRQIRCIDANSCPNWDGADLPDGYPELQELYKQSKETNFKLYGPRDYAIFAVKEK